MDQVATRLLKLLAAYVAGNAAHQHVVPLRHPSGVAHTSGALIIGEIAALVDEINGDSPHRSLVPGLSTADLQAEPDASHGKPFPDWTAQTPLPMILYCPSCSLQHVDAPSPGWDNRPHRSHLCQSCGHVWRPADVPTTGVAAIQTRGKNDSVTPRPCRAVAIGADMHCNVCDLAWPANAEEPPTCGRPR